MSENISLDFPITLYGNLEKYNETISKCRCRIFYKYGNRNGAYITDEFAEKLISTIPYAPIKGIYEPEGGDYTDHGQARSQGRIYGIVPENPNFAWETHLDEDGIERTYACVDVLVFTALYTEANAIVGKSQSMELYPPSIKGEWKIIDGRKYYVYNDASFFGLQILGDDVEPCFEGAAFFSLYQDLKKIVSQLETFNLSLHSGGKKTMNFKLSDNQKFNALWTLLNPNYNEENEWAVEYSIYDVFDEYAVVRNHSEGIYERVYYTKNDENDSVSIDRKERCYILDVSEGEKKALEALHTMNNYTYESVDELYSSATDSLSAKQEELDGLKENYSQEKENFELKIAEQDNTISTLTTEKDDIVSQLAEARISLNSLTEENNALKTFKADFERNEKTAAIAKYEKLLPAEVIATYTAKIDEYTSVKALEKDLAYELVSTNHSVFTSNGTSSSYIPKDEPLTGLEGILSKYRK